MRRYIEEGEFWNRRPENLDPKRNEYNRGWNEYAKEILKALNDTPTADVAEVKHGHWIKNHNEKKCSECGFIYYSNNDDFNYCANCGAKMLERTRKNDG